MKSEERRLRKELGEIKAQIEFLKQKKTQIETRLATLRQDEMIKRKQERE